MYVYVSMPQFRSPDAHQMPCCPLHTFSVPSTRASKGELGTGAPTSISPRSPLRTQALNLGSLLQAT